MDFGNRLKSLRISSGYTQKELGKKIGVTEVTIGNWERGTKTPGLAAIISLGDALSVSLDTLADFKPPNDRRTTLLPEEGSLIEKYRRLDVFGRKAVSTICEIELARLTEGQQKHNTGGKILTFPSRMEKQRYIPAYRSPSAAGIAVPLEGNEFEMILADSSVPADADFAVRIQGDSMSPYIEDGSMVFVSKSGEISNGDVGIFCVDGAMYCKQFFKDQHGNVYLLSANPDREDANVFLAADSGSTLSASGKVILGASIPLPEYFEI